MRLVFVPALACDADLYAPLIERLGADFDCITVVPAQPTLRECVGAVLAAAGSERFVVCGTSFGGHVARETAFAAPDRVAGLVIMGAGAAGVADPAPLEKRRAAIESGRRAEMLEEMARAIVFEPDGRGRTAADGFRRMAARCPDATLLAQNEALLSRPDRRADLGSLSCRTLLVWGEHDAFSPVAAAREIAAALPDAELIVLPDCGHLPSLEATTRVADAIRARFAG
ncbi:alpha/beta fold hydrolase [Aureimonas leprariae]|uniref:Alpha/beta fold hydrolase n=1 Tax=Plantimonas leprariae TaxID=2615207 RepID=A0A7V7PT96_9HYPH|nr:alpha/beta hydrolase [Aureimonas leprariae]KAB0682828.1 alpha/beta fold hydrolase [Aureimonas leprariae]